MLETSFWFRTLDPVQSSMRAEVARIQEYNTNPDLIFSANEHYLNDLIKKMVAADDLMSTDDGGLRHAMHNVRAFIKVQRKDVCEQGAKAMVHTFLCGNEKRLRKLLGGEACCLEEHIRDPPDLVAKRRTLLAHKEVLERAIAIMG